MRWVEKRPKSADANLKQVGEQWNVRVRIKLPDGTLFERELVAATKTAARKTRDDVFAAYNELALSILAGEDQRAVKPRPEGMILQDLANRCRDEWWPARGRSVEIAEQYFQKMRDYVIPALGADRPVASIEADDWDRVLAAMRIAKTETGKPLSTGTMRKVKAVFSSALTCAAARKVISANPLKGITFDPDPLSEADRLGVDIEDLADEETPAKRMLTDREAKQLLAGAKGSGIYPLIVLQLAFGLRIAEALAVRWGDIDWARKELLVRAQVKRRRNPKWAEGSEETKTVLQRVPVLKSKAGRREVMVFPDALTLLDTLQKGKDGDLVVASETGGLMEPRNAQRAFKTVVDSLVEKEKIAFPPPTTHSMRSWRLSHWANVVGLPASHLMRLAGHSRIETTMMFYVRADGHSLRTWYEGRSAVPARSPLAS